MAKVYDNLFPVTRFTNLYAAFRKAARGKRGQPAVAAFEFNLETNLLRVQRELQGHRYSPGPYASFYVRDPKQGASQSGGKKSREGCVERTLRLRLLLETG